jgi:hypothetical protein
VIVALFGAASYIEPRFIAGIPRLATSQGLTVLMHYREGYVPHYDLSVPETAGASREAAAALPGAHVFELNNFQVVTVKRD